MSTKKKETFSKSHLLYVKKVKKGLDNNSQLKVKSAQFYVFQRKKIKITLIKVPKSRKKYSIIGRNNTEIYEKITLKITLIIGLKIRKSCR